MENINSSKCQGNRPKKFTKKTKKRQIIEKLIFRSMLCYQLITGMIIRV